MHLLFCPALSLQLLECSRCVDMFGFSHCNRIDQVYTSCTFSGGSACLRQSVPFVLEAVVKTLPI